MIVLNIILMILMMTEFTKGNLARLKMFYKENEQKGRRVFIMQNFKVKFDTYLLFWS